MIWLQYTIQSMLASLGMTLAIIFAVSPWVHAVSMLLLGVSAVLLILSYAIFPHLAFEQLRTDVIYESALAQTFYSVFNTLRWIASVAFWGWSIYLGVQSALSWTLQTVQLPLISWFLAYCVYPASYVQRHYGDRWFEIEIAPHDILDLAFHLFVSPIKLPLRALQVVRQWLD